MNNKINQKTTLIIILFTLLFIPTGIDTFAEERPFITTWNVDGNNFLQIPTSGVGYNYTIDWGDGTIDTEQTSNASHIYDNSGTYTVSISGDFPRIYLKDSSYASKLITVDQWGDIEWTSMRDAFRGAVNMNVIATDAPDLSGVTSMILMFYNADSFNGDISNWDVSSVLDMRYMFRDTNFNGDISNWDVSSVLDMNNMLVNTPLSTINYDKLLDNWSKLPTLQNNVDFHSSSKYCDVGEIGRNIMFGTYGWNISDSGKNTVENCDFIYGVPAPTITSLVADDPDDLDDVYSADDTITITFDSDTNTPGGLGVQTKTNVDDLYNFTEYLGETYTGQWIAVDTFVITITNTTGASPPVISGTTVTPTGITPILSSNATSEPSTITSPVLSGDFGIVALPPIPPVVNPWIHGSNGAIYYDNGNVDIGVTNPENTLHVSGETFFGNGNGNTHFPWVDGNNYISGIYTIFRDSSNVEVARIVGSTGNVGIGTSTPNSKLQITDGYIQLDVSSGLPPTEDCDVMEEVGRMKVDDSTTDLYICTFSGWVTK